MMPISQNEEILSLHKLIIVNSKAYFMLPFLKTASYAPSIAVWQFPTQI